MDKIINQQMNGTNEIICDRLKNEIMTEKVKYLLGTNLAFM